MLLVDSLAPTPCQRTHHPNVVKGALARGISNAIRNYSKGELQIKYTPLLWGCRDSLRLLEVRAYSVELPGEIVTGQSGKRLVRSKQQAISETKQEHRLGQGGWFVVSLRKHTGML